MATCDAYYVLEKGPYSTIQYLRILLLVLFPFGSFWNGVAFDYLRRRREDRVEKRLFLVAPSLNLGLKNLDQILGQFLSCLLSSQDVFDRLNGAHVDGHGMRVVPKSKIPSK